MTRTTYLTNGLVLIIGLLAAGSARADVFNVNTFDDGNDGSCAGGCTLREAVALTTGTAGADEILLQAGTYTLTMGGVEDSALGGDLDINVGQVTISGVGRGQTIITSAAIDRIFQVGPWSTATLILRDLTIDGGGVVQGIVVHADDTLVLENVEVTGCVWSDDGAGLNCVGSATMTDCVFTGNTVTAPFGNGAAMFCRGTDATIIAERCLFSGNSAPNGGAACFTDVLGTSTFTNCTFSGNTGSSSLLTNTFATINLYSCTVTQNYWGTANSGTMNAKNSIVAGNSVLDVNGTINSEGYNILNGAVTITGDTTGNILNVNPMMGALADNGGPTLTHAPLAGSPAIDAAHPTDFPAIDQRGAARPVDGDNDASSIADIGAFEFDGVVITDCNGNGVDDATDLANGTALDCDGNGIPDSCDIADGTLADANGTGIPDVCEGGGDSNGDGVTNVTDLLALLDHWGPCASCPEDTNFDGVVDVTDLLNLLANWG